MMEYEPRPLDLYDLHWPFTFNLNTSLLRYCLKIFYISKNQIETKFSEVEKSWSLESYNLGLK